MLSSSMLPSKTEGIMMLLSTAVEACRLLAHLGLELLECLMFAHANERLQLELREGDYLEDDNVRGSHSESELVVLRCLSIERD